MTATIFKFADYRKSGQLPAIVPQRELHNATRIVALSPAVMYTGCILFGFALGLAWSELWFKR